MDREEAQRYVGNRIYSFRKLKGWSRAKLAAEVGLSSETIGHLERGERRRMDVEQLREIARVLDTSLSQLLGELTREEHPCLEL
jgi:transcriptional regulator with XRE-family HTH domain